MRITYLSQAATRQTADIAFAKYQAHYKACRTDPSETNRQATLTAYQAFQAAALAAGPSWQPETAH